MSNVFFLKGPIDKPVVGKPLGLVSPSFGHKGKMSLPPTLPTSSMPRFGQEAPVRFMSDIAPDIKRSVHDAVGIDQVEEREENITAYQKTREMMRAAKSQNRLTGSAVIHNIPAGGIDTVSDVKRPADGLDEEENEMDDRYKLKLGTGVTFSRKIRGGIEREMRKKVKQYRMTFKNLSKDDKKIMYDLIEKHATHRYTGTGYSWADRRRMKHEVYQLWRQYKISKPDMEDFKKIIDSLE